MIDSLRQLGLSETEALIYSELVERGPSFIAPLVKATKKHRQIIYNALDSLLERNLVSVSQKNGKHYYAISNPDRLVIDLQQKAVVARQLAASVKAKLAVGQEKVEVFVGPEAYVQGLADFRRRAEEAQEYIVIGGNPGEWQNFTRPFFQEHLTDLRRLKHLGIPIMTLFFDTSRAQAERYFYQYINDPYILKISAHTPPLPQTVWIAGEHVYQRTPVSDPLVIHTQSKALAESYRKYFDALWRTAKVVRP